MNTRFLRREAAHAWIPLAMVAISVALAILGLVAVGSLRQNVDESLGRQARGLIACDLQVRAMHPPSDAVLHAIDALGSQVDHSIILEMFSMVSARPDRVVLSQVKVVEPSYPWYGAVKLGSGRSLHDVLVPGQVVAEPSLLNRLGISVGDSLHIGGAQLVLADTVLQEPDRPLAWFAVAPRILVCQADLARTALIRPGSNVGYRQLLRIHPPATPESVADAIRPAAAADHDRLQSWQSAEGQLQRYFDAMLTFLTTIACFTMVLGGLCIQSTLSAFLNGRRRTIAMLKALGATSNFVRRHYGTLVAAFAALGLALGVAAGLAIQFIIPHGLEGLLGPDFEVTLAPGPVGVAAGLGVLLTVVFARRPLDALQDVRPHQVFKFEEGSGRLAVPWAGLAFALAALWFEVRSPWETLIAAGAIVALLLVTGTTCGRMVRALQSVRLRPLAPRLAVLGLRRPGNQSWLVAVSLATALSVLFTLMTLEQSLRDDFLAAWPVDSPNVFFIDIQKDQVNAFRTALRQPADFYPVVRARVTTVNGQAVPHEDNPEYRKGNLDREVRLTYRNQLQSDEHIQGDGPLFRAGTDEAQVSLVQELASEAHLGLGDRLVFDIQGVELPAVVSSIRTLTGGDFKPDFEFVLNPPALADAPTTFFTGLQLRPEAIPPLQNRLAAAFPNVTSLDVHDTLQTLSVRLGQLIAIVHFFTALSMGTGLLMLVGTLVSTQAARLRESVYYQMLGARRGFVAQVVVWEGLLLGGMASGLACLLSQALSYGLCRYGLDIAWHSGGWLGPALAVPLGLAALGLAASVPLLSRRPADYLRQHEDDSG